MQTLRLYCDVAQLRSFSRAAREHGITQSAASQRISQLERKLGAALLDRSVRPLDLTPAGELFARECRKLIRRYDDLEQRVCEQHSGPEGELTVAAIYSAGVGLLNQLKDRFEVEYPRIDVTLAYDAPQQVHDAVVQQKCDLGIVSYPQSWRDVDHVLLRDEVMAVVCSPRHKLAKRQRLNASDLDGLDMAAFDAKLPVARHIGEYLKRHEVRPNVTHTFDNIDTIRGAVEVTHLAAVLPKRTVLREVAAGRLVVVDLEPKLVRPIGVIQRKRRRNGKSNGRPGSPGRHSGSASNGAHSAATNGCEAPPTLTRLFVDFLIQHAGPNPDTLDDIEARGRQLVGDNV